jgi:hypothetical protein
LRVPFDPSRERSPWYLAHPKPLEPSSSPFYGSICTAHDGCLREYLHLPGGHFLRINRRKKGRVLTLL